MTGSTYRSVNVAADRGMGLTLLLRGIADRDRNAFAMLHAALAPGLRALIVAGGLSERDADAVLATTFVEMWQLTRLPIDGDPQLLEWIRKAVERRCSERRYRMRESAWSTGPAGADSTWQRLAAEKDASAQLALTDLLRGDPAATGSAPPGQAEAHARPVGTEPPYERPVRPEAAGEQARSDPAPQPWIPDGGPPTAIRPRVADLGAAAVFGHRRRRPSHGPDRLHRPDEPGPE